MTWGLLCNACFISHLTSTPYPVPARGTSRKLLFSPVWVRSCRGTAPLLVNQRGHIEQAYGFLPV